MKLIKGNAKESFLKNSLYKNMPLFLFIIRQVFSDHLNINIASSYLAWFRGVQKDFDIIFLNRKRFKIYYDTLYANNFSHYFSHWVILNM